MLQSRQVLATGAALCVGSAATLLPRALLESACAGDGRALAAPVFAALCCMLASTAALLVPPLLLRVALRPARAYAPVILPGVLSVAGTLLQLAALVYIRASVLAGLRGAFIVFTAVVSSRVLPRLKDAPASPGEWACVAASGLGALLVGTASELLASMTSGTAPARGIGIGLAFSLLGYAVATAQVRLEQLALDGLGFSRYEILGVEGLVGAVACGALLLALTQVSGAWLEEAGLDAPQRVFACLRETPLLPALGVLYGASSLALNALLLLLASDIGPNFRVFIFTARGALTWCVEVLLFYLGSAAVKPIGAQLSPFSVLQVLGFSCLIAGGWLRVSLQQRRERAEAEESSRGKLLEGAELLAEEPELLLVARPTD